MAYASRTPSWRYQHAAGSVGGVTDVEGPPMMLARTTTVAVALVLCAAGAAQAAAMHGDPDAADGVVLELDRVGAAAALPDVGGARADLRAPGHVESVHHRVRNAGSVSADLVLGISRLVGIEDGCSSSSERRDDDDCATDTVGDLPGQIHLAVALAPVRGDGTCAPSAVGTVPLVDGRLDAFTVGPITTATTLDPGQEVCVVTTSTFLDLPTNNVAMGDDVDVQLRVTLEQR